MFLFLNHNNFTDQTILTITITTSTVPTITSTNATAGTGNGTFENQSDDFQPVVKIAVLAFILGLIIFATIIGNLFVIAAILLERNLQNVSNYLILSLAVADLLVACIVMPFSAIYEINKKWRLGPQLCDVWTASDVLCCTASILHLVAIALDRYWAVTNIEYIRKRTANRICIMIALVWLLAFLVSIAPIFGWKDADWQERVETQQICLISQDLGYQVFATASSFYVPLLFILILYWRIYKVARKRIRRRQGPVRDDSLPPIPGAPSNPSGGGVIAAAGGSGGVAAAVIAIIGRPTITIDSCDSSTATRCGGASSGVVSKRVSVQSTPERTSTIIIENDEALTSTTTASASMSASASASTSNYQQLVAKYHYQPHLLYKSLRRRKRRKEASETKRERKAAKTLSIITGAFVFCWLPFFVLAILLPVYSANYFNPLLISAFLWLGYLNSTLNPILYTIFSPEFRLAFKKLLLRRSVRNLKTRAAAAAAATASSSCRQKIVRPDDTSHVLK